MARGKQAAQADRASAGPDDDQDAREPARDPDPAVDGDPLPEQRGREGDHQENRRDQEPGFLIDGLVHHAFPSTSMLSA